MACGRGRPGSFLVARRAQLGLPLGGRWALRVVGCEPSAADVAPRSAGCALEHLVRAGRWLTCPRSGEVSLGRTQRPATDWVWGVVVARGLDTARICRSVGCHARWAPADTPALWQVAGLKMICRGAPAARWGVWCAPGAGWHARAWAVTGVKVRAALPCAGLRLAHACCGWRRPAWLSGLDAPCALELALGAVVPCVSWAASLPLQMMHRGAQAARWSIWCAPGAG